jgi:hypothetical protein
MSDAKFYPHFLSKQKRLIADDDDDNVGVGRTGRETGGDVKGVEEDDDEWGIMETSSTSVGIGTEPRRGVEIKRSRDGARGRKGKGERDANADARKVASRMRDVGQGEREGGEVGAESSEEEGKGGSSPGVSDFINDMVEDGGPKDQGDGMEKEKEGKGKERRESRSSSDDSDGGLVRLGSTTSNSS